MCSRRRPGTVPGPRGGRLALDGIDLASTGDVVRPRLLVVLSMSLVASCGGSSRQPAASTVQPDGVQPVPTVAEADDVQKMLVDIASHEICERMTGRFAGLTAADADVTTGRLRIERCADEQRNGEVVLEAKGRGWRWVDRQKEKLGAVFGVSGYMPLSVDAKIVGTVQHAYAADERAFHLWLDPTAPVEATVRPLVEVDAESSSLWGDLLGAAAAVVAQGPDSQATQAVRKKGTRSVSRKLSDGYSVVVDLCSGQRHASTGWLPEGTIPSVPRDPKNRVWLTNTAVRLQPGGIDLAGPFRSDRKLTAAIRLRDGAGFEAQWICDSAAVELADAFIARKPLPSVEALSTTRVPPGQEATLVTDRERCDPVLSRSSIPVSSSRRPSR